MGWEQRGNNLYYYRKKRMGHHVASEYLGYGPSVQLLSGLDQEERKELISLCVRWKKQKQEIQSLDGELNSLDEITATLVKAVLLTSGYHPHKGQWRRNRNV